ncbi:hypothetical protein [Rhizobium rhizogenes]|uniref:hypothetical protein n=1 Tax=Rhizobium rhizogenes TaxID=359 RepID=UPI0009B8A295|nr:hypothetical protein [Rhizobium rhizogenes]
MKTDVDSSQHTHLDDLFRQDAKINLDSDAAVSDAVSTFYSSLQGSPVDCDPKSIWGYLLVHADWVDVSGNHQSMIVGRNASTPARELSERLVR